jgi:hypothetical protein
VLQPFTEGDSRYQATLTFGGSAGKREGIAWPLRTLLVGVSLWWASAFGGRQPLFLVLPRWVSAFGSTTEWHRIASLFALAG